MHEPAFLSEPAQSEQPLDPRDPGRRGTVSEWHTFFAAEIPYLTAFLAGYDDSRGPELRDALLRDVLARQASFLRGMHQVGHASGSLELRFCFEPSRRRIRLFLLGKGASDRRSVAEELSRQLWRHLEASFPHAFYPFQPIAGAGGEEKLRALLDFPGDAETLHLAELRRHETEEHLELGQTGYLVFPLEGSPESLTALFPLLSWQTEPCVISVGLRPTEITAEERNLLGVIASACRELARRSEQTVSAAVEKVSIPAGDVADLYTTYLRRLQNPFLFRLSVAGPGKLSHGLLSSLEADVSHPVEVADAPRRMPNRKADFVRPEEPWQRRLAWHNLRYLEHADWMPRRVQPRYAELSRLRRLVDAEGAVGAFRIPIPPVGGLPGMDSRPPSLFEPLPESMLYPAPEASVLPLGPVHLPIRLLTQHALVAGTIGSGKTNTSVQLLALLWERHRIPFLVLEPVNAEHDDYRSLGRRLSVPDELRIFTLGDESTSPLRLNPFEVPPGVILNTHIAGLMACFLAALPMGDGPLPALFREALRNIYFARGWHEDERGGERPDAEIPGLPALRDELDWLIGQRYGARTETAQTLIGASVTRVNALINSSAGRILMARRSIPLPELFDKPTLLELRHLGSDEDKALLTGFLLLALQEYSDRNRPVGTGRLHHMVFLEEAHNLMEEPKKGAADDAKAAAVKFFTNMLAENRKYGQGFVIVEQIPTLLAQGALKNTVTKVMHRLPGPDDIDWMGATMNFKERHKARAAALKPGEGEAFFYTDGLNEATLIHIPYFDKSNLLSDREVAEKMTGFREQYPEVYAEELPFAGCRWCEAQCRYRRRVSHLAYDRKLGDRVIAAYEAADPSNKDATVRGLTAPIRERLGDPGGDHVVTSMIYCAFLHLQGQLKRLQNIANVAEFKKRIPTFL